MAETMATVSQLPSNKGRNNHISTHTFKGKKKEHLSVRVPSLGLSGLTIKRFHN